ncbi:MAG: hypothetical protein U5K28_10345 [Halobacteriales archaeon]|nr:hypothetical protein [Halobacteriales archaeon]
MLVDASPLEVRVVALVSDGAAVVAMDHAHLVEPFEVVAGGLGIAVSEIGDVGHFRRGSKPSDDVEEPLADRATREQRVRRL